MKKSFFIILSLFVAAVLLALTHSDKQKIADKNNGQGFVVMELFTSQGCSSCPHADDLLGSYAEKNDSRIIPIAFHVDYWNELGWKDSFSNAQYSWRQQYYNEKFLHADVYTPQLVINGNKEMVGNNDLKVKVAVDNALNETPVNTINFSYQTIANRQLQIQYAIDGSTANTTLDVALIQHKTTTKIKAGENNGATLINYNVVRSFVYSPANASGTSFVKLPTGVDLKELSIVLFIQSNLKGLKT